MIITNFPLRILAHVVIILNVTLASIVCSQETKSIAVKFETAESKQKADLLEDRAIKLYWDTKQKVLESAKIKKMGTRIEEYAQNYQRASEAASDAYRTHQLEAQLVLTNKANQYLSSMLEAIREEIRATNKEIWSLIGDSDREAMAKYMTFLARDAKADNYLKNRGSAEVPNKWKEFKDTGSNFRAYVPTDMQSSESRKGKREFKCKSTDGAYVFRVVVHNRADSSVPAWARPRSAKDASETEAFGNGANLEYSGRCQFAGAVGHEVEYTLMSPSPRRVSVRSIRHKDSILVFSCERDVHSVSTRIPNAFFDSISLLR